MQAGDEALEELFEPIEGVVPDDRTSVLICTKVKQLTSDQRIL